jgi:inosose dehydratase
MSQISRRRFLGGIGALSAAAVSSAAASSWLKPLTAQTMNLTPFDTNSSQPAGAIRLGYAAMTWGSDGRKAIEDISSVGFHGIQLRADAITAFEPAELRDILQQHGLTFVALSSGNIHIDPAVEADDLALHTKNAKFVHDAGGLYLQVIDQPPKRDITAADYKRLGYMLTEVGKRTADLGIPLGYHNHMGSLSERPENLDRILDATDPRYAKLELDVAHYLQGGGDPVKAIDKYHDRVLFLHLKDVRDADPSTEGVKGPYQWVELGRGKVDLPAVVQALEKYHFKGWAVVELDRVPDKGRSPKASAEINRKYVEETLKLPL